MTPTSDDEKQKQRAMLRDPDIIAAGRAHPDRRIYHRAHLTSPKGVSALCFKKPRAIDMRPESRETWTTDDAAVGETPEAYLDGARVRRTNNGPATGGTEGR